MVMINNVNHKNLVVMYSYLKNFAREKGLKEDNINIFEQLNLPYPHKYDNALSYYTDISQWSPLETYVKCYLKVKDITGDPDIFRKCGRSAARYKSIGNWRQIARSISGPRAALSFLPQIFRDWNDTKIVELIKPPEFNVIEQQVEATLQYTFHPHISPCEDYCSDPHILGLLEAMPTNYPMHIWKPWDKLPLGESKQRLVQYDPIKLFTGIFFKHLDLRPVQDGNKLFIRNPKTDKIMEIGRKVILIPSVISGRRVYLGNYKDINGKAKSEDCIGTLITETLSVHGEPVCEEGVIMEAPYFLINYTCKESQLTRSFLNLGTFFMGRGFLLNEVFRANDALRKEIEEKNKAYNKIKEYTDHLEEMVEKRTAELRETQSKLIEADKLKSNFFANVSHEVRTPLTLLISPIESILQGDYNGAIDENFFKGLHRNSVRLLELINSMLDFAKIEAGHMSMKVTPVEIVQMVKNWIGTIHSVCEMRIIELSFISLNKSVEIWIDINKFEKIVMNLIILPKNWTGQ